MLPDGYALRPLALADSAPLAEAYLRNQDHLRRWEPRRPDEFFTEAGQRAAIGGRLEQVELGLYDCWVLWHGTDVVGTANLQNIVRGAMQGDEREFTTIDPVVEETRIDLSLAWSQGRFIDPGARRDACARLCIARKDGVQALISFDFWLSDLAGCGLLWKAFLTSLQLGEWVADPRVGPRLS